MTPDSAFTVGVLVLCGTLFGILFTRMSRLEDRVNKAEGLVTKLHEWAVKTVARYERHRKDGSPDLDPIPGYDD